MQSDDYHFITGADAIVTSFFYSKCYPPVLDHP